MLGESRNKNFNGTWKEFLLSGKLLSSFGGVQSVFARTVSFQIRHGGE